MEQSADPVLQEETLVIFLDNLKVPMGPFVNPVLQEQASHHARQHQGSCGTIVKLSSSRTGEQIS